jgi:Holliday junction resolvase
MIPGYSSNAKLDIHDVIAITGSIPLLVDMKIKKNQNKNKNKKSLNMISRNN